MTSSQAMARSRLVATIWSWLPAFRVVAEYESIQKAAIVTATSASALSRTVKLIEEALGQTLFVRTSTGLALTPFGADLLSGARDAMRRVDDVIASAPSTPPRPPNVVAGTNPVLTDLLARAVGRVARSEAPESRYQIVAIDEGAAPQELLRGNVDVALVEDAAPAPGVEREHLGSVAFARYAARGERRDGVVGLERLNDGPLRLVATAPTVDLVARIAEESGLLALLPVPLAPAHFCKVAASEARVEVVALTRRPVQGGASGGFARAVLDAVRALLAG